MSLSSLCFLLSCIYDDISARKNSQCVEMCSELCTILMNSPLQIRTLKGQKWLENNLGVLQSGLLIMSKVQSTSTTFLFSPKNKSISFACICPSSHLVLLALSSEGFMQYWFYSIMLCTILLYCNCYGNSYY